MNGLMIQICQNYNPFNLIVMLLIVIIVMIERRFTLYQGWKIHVMGVTLPRIRGFSYVTWQVFAILPINAMVAK